MSGSSEKAVERPIELMAYHSNGRFLSWYRCDATQLLAASGRRNGPTWNAQVRDRLATALPQPSFLDMVEIGDPGVSVSLLTFTPNTALVELHRGGVLVAVASLHRTAEPHATKGFAQHLETTIPMWCNDNLIEDIMMAEDGAMIFLVKASGGIAEASWNRIYEGALLMMAAYVHEPPALES